MLSIRSNLLKQWLPAVLIHIAAGTGILYLYYTDNAVRWEIIPVHALLVFASFTLITAMGLVLLNRLNYDRRVLHLICSLFIAFSAWYLSAHLTTAVAVLFWSDNVQLLNLLDYWPSLPLLLELNGISPVLTAIVFVGFVILILIAWFLWFRSLVEFFESIRNVKWTRKQILPLTIISFICFASIAGYAVSIKSGHLLSFRGEPFADRFRNVPVHSLRFKQGDLIYQQHQQARLDFQDGLPYEFDQRNVIIIMLDAARADHMSVYGYERETTPFLDSLYHSGKLTRVDYATSTCSQSECGITTMLSSTFYTRTHQVNYKMHEALYDTGYDVNFLLSGDHSRAYSFMKHYYGPKISRFKDGFDAAGQMSTDDYILLDFLDELPDFPEAGLSFFYLHMMSPHTLGRKHEPFLTFQPSDPLVQTELFGRSRFDPLNKEDQQRLINNYDNGIYQSDAFIKKLFNLLKEKGFLENALVVITADHGEGLGEHGIYGHGVDLHNITINVPLLFYDSISANRNVRNLPYGTLIDIPVIIFEMLGLPVPSNWEGINLFSEERTLSHHTSTHPSGHQAVIKKIDDTFYFLLYNRPDQSFWLYNLNEDFYKTRNIISSADPELIEIMKEAYFREFGR